VPDDSLHPSDQPARQGAVDKMVVVISFQGEGKDCQGSFKHGPEQTTEAVQLS